MTRVARSIQDKALLAGQPLGRVATPEEVAQVVSYCAFDAPFRGSWANT